MMLRIISCISFILFFHSLYAQKNAPRVWSREEIADAFGEDLRYEGIPVSRVLEFRDKAGVWAMVLCEDRASIQGKDTINTKLKAVCLLNDHGGYIQKWAVNDFLLREPEIEKTICFRTNYCSFTDIDGDGLADPVLVYTSITEDGVQRLKIITYHKGQKYIVRAVESITDEGRQLRFSPAPAATPPAIRKYVQELLGKLRKEQDLLLKEG